MKEFYTQDGSRDDLVQQVKLTTLLEKGYAFPRIFPVVLQLEKAGTMSYAPKGQTSAKGQKGRANGAAIDKTTVASLSLNWTVARIEGRAQVFESEVKGLGGIENCDFFGGTEAARKTMNTAESDAYAKIFTTARTGAAEELPDRAVIRTLQKSAIKVRAYGKPYLVMSTNAWLRFCDIPEVRARLYVATAGTGDLGFLTMQDAKIMQIISTLLMFEGVILFDSEIVGADQDGFVAVIGLRPEAMSGDNAAVMVAKSRATYGVTMVYLPDEANREHPFTIQSHADRDTKANVYDSEGWLSQNELHADAVVVTEFALAYTEIGQAPAPAPIP